MTSLPRRAVSAAVLTALVAPVASAAGESSTTAPRPEGIRRVTPLVQTPPVFDDEAGGDADADDPAIWVHPTDRSRSRVVATVKNAGCASTT